MTDAPRRGLERMHLVLLGALIARLVVAYFWVGSTDANRWLFFFELIEKREYRSLYFSENPLWNHPAPMILFLKLTASFTPSVFRFTSLSNCRPCSRTSGRPRSWESWPGAVDLSWRRATPFLRRR